MYNMDSNYHRMLKELMAADFTIIDLNLYLDTHPYDQRAINIYNENVKKAKVLRDNFERMYGPLTIANTTKCPYEWIQSPWPWERRM